MNFKYLVILLIFFTNCSQYRNNGKVVSNIQVVSDSSNLTNNKNSENGKKDIDQLFIVSHGLLESTKNIILRNQKIPSFQIYQKDSVHFHNEILRFYLDLYCDDNKEYEQLNTYTIEFNKYFENSYENTGITDGKVFCLKKLNSIKNANCLITYHRNEGGHTSDKIGLIVIDSINQDIYVLPLSYNTGWDGHKTEVASNIVDNIITRKITEWYGWSPSTHPDSIALQPRREVVQIFEVNKNSNLKLLRETIFKYNIDELFK